MRHPNRRYGNPAELEHFAGFYPDKQRIKIIAEALHRDERTVRDWMSGRRKVPFWVPELLRLRRMEHDEMLRQMNIQPMRRLGVVSTAGVLEFKPPKVQTTEPIVKEPDLFTLRKQG